MADNTADSVGSAASGALGGVAAGSALGPIGMGVGGALGLFGGLLSASARGDAANAQAGAAGYDRQAALDAAQPSYEELAQARQQIGIGRQSLARVNALLASVDPVLIEAGKQALAMMRGEKARVLQPIQEERDRGRAALVSQLYARQGSGALDGDSGRRALADYDRETGLIISGAQQKSLNDIMGFLTSNKVDYGQTADITKASSDTLNNFANRKIAAITGNKTAPYAGAGFMGQALTGNAIGEFGTGLAKAGAAFAGQNAGRNDLSIDGEITTPNPVPLPSGASPLLPPNYTYDTPTFNSMFPKAGS